MHSCGQTAPGVGKLNLHQLARRVAARSSHRATPRTLRRAWTATDSRLARARGLEIVHVLHIPKTGGTAIQHALREVHSTHYAIRLWHHSFRFCDAPCGDKVAFFVRDPVERFTSAFNFRKLKGLLAHPEEWTEAETTLFSAYPTANDLAEALPSEEASVMAREIMQFAPMGNWLGGPRDLERRASDILFVGRVESLNVDFTALCEVLGVVACLPTDRTRSNRVPRTADTHLSERAQTNLRDWYSVDYKLLATIDALGKYRQ